MFTLRPCLPLCLCIRLSLSLSLSPPCPSISLSYCPSWRVSSCISSVAEPITTPPTAFDDESRPPTAPASQRRRRKIDRYACAARRGAALVCNECRARRWRRWLSDNYCRTGSGHAPISVGGWRDTGTDDAERNELLRAHCDRDVSSLSCFIGLYWSLFINGASVTP